MEIMSIANLAMRQLGIYTPSLSSGSTSDTWFSPLIEWVIRIAVVGLFATAFKTGRSRHGPLESIRIALFPITHINGGGAYKWISLYIAQDPDVQRQLRDRVITAEDEDAPPSPRHHGHYDLGDYDDRHQKSKPRGGTWIRMGVAATVNPVADQDLLIRFQDRKIWVTKHGKGTGENREWSISTWFWNRDLIDDLILAAHKMYHQKVDNEIHIYNHSYHAGSGWIGPLRRPARPWESVILPRMVKENLLIDVEEFLSKDEKAWYASKGIPHRRGYLLHGPPGSGKTTLATAVASKLRLSLYCVSPASAGMDNSKLERLFQICPPGSLLFIEDIDCVMPVKRSALNSSQEALSEPIHIDNSPWGKVRNPRAASSVTLAGLLNAIDGVASQEDSVLFASTNFPNHLDEALKRPGRFDVDIAFTFATHEQAVCIFKHFYAKTSTAGSPEAVKVVLDEAAQTFADTIMKADIQVSLATIQGYLLLYKRDPIKAQEKVADWAEELRVKQLAAEGEIKKESESA